MFQHNEPLYKDYSICASLGTGACAKVYLLRNPIGDKLVCKFFYPTNPNYVRTIYNTEKEYLQRCKNIPNVVQYVDKLILTQGPLHDEILQDMSETDNIQFSKVTRLCGIIMEYVNGLDLFEYLKLHSDKMYKVDNNVEEFTKEFLSQMIPCIKTMHDMNITHGDIKLENIMVYIEDNRPQFKLIDFSFCKDADSYILNGTNGYYPTYSIEKYNSSGFLTLSDLKLMDIFALGVTAYMIIHDMVEPFKRYPKPKDLLYNHKEFIQPNSKSTFLNSIITQMLLYPHKGINKINNMWKWKDSDFFTDNQV